MNKFALARPRSFEEASQLAKSDRYSLPVLKAGGMDVLDHMKEGLYEPDLLIDLRRLQATQPANKGAPPITMDSDHIVIEANATLADIAKSDIIRREFPGLAHAAGSAATPQVRNVASAAGNLLQRPRCWYYRHDQFHCLKKGGSTCFAVDGENAYHAILGGGPCWIVHPSNIAPALLIADGEIHLVGGDREKVAIRDLYHLPEQGVRSEHDLQPGEVITHITLAPRPRSGFSAVKEKQSFDWPLAFAIASLELKGDTISACRVCAGAVAPVPWALPKVEAALKGVSLDDEQALKDACAQANEGANPLSQNGYKTKLLPVVVRRAVLKAAGREVPGEEEQDREA